MALKSSPINVTINASNLPEFSNIVCILTDDKKNSIGSKIVSIKQDVSSLICSIEITPPDVTHGFLDLYINSSVQATSDFLFYNCSNFTRCRDCVGIIISQCNWCSASMTCKSKYETCGRGDTNVSQGGDTNVSQTEQCPQLMPTELYVHADVTTAVTFKAMNLQIQFKNYQCILLSPVSCVTMNNGKVQCVTVNNTFPALGYNSTGVTCELNISMQEYSKKEVHHVIIKYNGTFLLDDLYNTNVAIIGHIKTGKSLLDLNQCPQNAFSVTTFPHKNFKRNITCRQTLVRLSEKHICTKTHTVTVYRCENLVSDCNHCTNLNKTRYKCTWCNGNCVYNDTVCIEACPEPNITKIIPHDGPIYGGTMLTISGTDIRRRNLSNTSITIAEKECKITQKPDPEDPDFEYPIYSLTYCTTDVLRKDFPVNQPWPLNVMLNGKVTMQTTTFTYQKPNVTSLVPKSGPMSGGTEITLSGSYLGIGNRHVTVKIGNKDCTEARVVPQVALDVSLESKATVNNFSIVCNTADVGEISTAMVLSLFMNGISVFNSSGEIGFSFKEDPVINTTNISKGFLSGGTTFKVQGTNMTYANKGWVTSVYGYDTQVEQCNIVSAMEVICKVPTASKSVWDELTSTRKKRSPTDGGIEVTIEISLDGVKKSFILTYFKNPVFDTFYQGQPRFRNTDQKIKITGRNLNLAASMEDFDVTVGGEKCLVINLSEAYLECVPPLSPPVSGSSVEIKVGNIQQVLGDLIYVLDANGKSNLGTIIGAVVGSVMAVIIIAAVIAIYKYRAVEKNAQEMEKTLNEIEMEIKRVAREEFFDMHTCMTNVNESLVEQGFPYHDYQQFACNTMFAPEYLLTESVVSNGKSTENYPTQIRQGLNSLEHLISNKFFLISIISTMEKQKRFFIREKANFAGNLCTILMGKMDYLKEILEVLLTNFIENSLDKKSQKSLFRRCESITEKLLTNWLTLCMYPHIKVNTGSPLYLLYMSICKTIEAGPIDVITGDAKYTLSEENLLKKWSSSENETSDLKFETRTLTLNVVVDNGHEIFKCKVLDCDTISQVKEKCLNQIYVNYPASQMGVLSQDLNLEWHEGFSGLMLLKDEDYTSKREKDWIRLNTLAHYSVKDNSNMALVDPNNVDNQEDYVNLEQINMDISSCKINIDSKQLVAVDKHPVQPLKLKQWHLIKKDEENVKQEKSPIAELYLSRLFTIKQQIIEYVRSFWDIVLDKDHCPPPTLLLYSFLDKIGEKLKIDQETVHSWKSHSYAIRVWTRLILNPALLFDVNVPYYVEMNLEVISQVFIESFSVSQQKCSKDTPSQKLIFHNELNQYREKVKEFYKKVKCNSLPSDDFRRYLLEVNMIQQTTNFNKVSALYRFYKQMRPFMDELIDDLSASKQASDLQLDKKLEKVIELLEERT